MPVVYQPYSSVMKVGRCYINDKLIETSGWTTECGALILLLLMYDPFQCER